jgi:hypothetical protein
MFKILKSIFAAYAAYAAYATYDIEQLYLVLHFTYWKGFNVSFLEESK